MRPTLARSTSTLIIPLLLFAPALLVCLPASASAGAAEDARRLLQMAESTDMEERASICRLIGEGRPAAFARHFCDGYEMASHGFVEEADVALARALEDRPDFALAAILYGELYEANLDFENAERYFRRAIEISPARTDARFALGSLLFRRGRGGDRAQLGAALAASKGMTEADPASPDGWSNLGLVLAYLGRFDEAESMYKRAIELNPRDPFLHDSLGSLYVRMDRNEDAAASWLKAIAINPGYGEAVIELAALYARTGRLIEAIQILEKERDAVQAPPWGPRIRRNLGFAYMGIDRLETAGDRFNEAVGKGGDALSHLGLAHLRMVQDNLRGALVAFERGAALDSALASPFVLAWRSSLRRATDPDRLPALDRVLKGAEALPAPAVAGKDATRDLISFVLSEWSFADSARVRGEIDGAVAGALAQYDNPPVPVQKFPAEYPESAQRAGLRGTVSVRVVVDEAGNVARAEMEKCDAPVSLCESAVAAARKWTFQPATRYGAPVQATIVIPFRFVASGR